jgi:Flp pilus assembly pilin Flp
MYEQIKRLRTDDAQNAFEYVLTAGLVVVAMVVAFLAFDAVIAQILGFVCPAVDTSDGLAAVGSCITSIGG